MNNNRCFDCLYHDIHKGIYADDTGWYHPCTKGIPNDGMLDIESCPEYSPNRGFQIGGYYTHMHFENTSAGPDNKNMCLDWIIHGDGEFPRTEKDEWVSIHICDFHQIERWVAFWGNELRKRGWVTDNDDEIIGIPDYILLDKLMAGLNSMDCGDSACIFAKDKSGQRTNGGCRCLSGLPSSVRIPLIQLWRERYV